MVLIDLSHPITAGMPVYPGDPQVAVTTALNIDDDGAAVARLELGTHTGTHLDAPAHTIPGGRTVDQLDLTLLDGEACILPVQTDQTESLQEQQLDASDLRSLPAELPRIVCIATGWDQYFHAALHEHHPYLGLELAQELWRRGARVLGVDTLSPDPTSKPAEFLVHEFWLGNDGIIVENLRQLTELPDRVHMTMLPLPLTGLDGSPVRAVARCD